MDLNWIGIGSSYIFVFLILVLAEIFLRKKWLSPEYARKFVHIAVSNWWLIAMFLIKSYVYAVIPPITFVFFNYFSYKKSLFESMEEKGGKAGLGTIYFPISLTLLVLLSWWDGLLHLNPYFGAVGVLIMGYGDGLAAVIGSKFGRRTFNVRRTSKSLEGSLAMFAISFFIALGAFALLSRFSFTALALALLVAFVSTLAEAFTPKGFDNITVPLLSFAVFTFLFKVFL